MKIFDIIWKVLVLLALFWIGSSIAMKLDSINFRTELIDIGLQSMNETLRDIQKRIPKD